MTQAAFLAWEERQELRWEFDGFEPVAMTCGTNAHEAIGGNLRALLHTALLGKRCSVRGPTMKIEAAGRIRYPDAFVFCSAAARDQTVIRDPVVVFEVLSASTIGSRSCANTRRRPRSCAMSFWSRTPSPPRSI
jgi:Uma2 family endonuclease